MWDRLTSEKTKTGLVLPLRKTSAHLTRRDAGTPKATVGRTANGYAQASPDITTHFGVGLLPLSGEQRGKSREYGIRFPTQHPISGDHGRYL